MVRRLITWGIGAALVALFAYAPFRDSNDRDLAAGGQRLGLGDAPGAGSGAGGDAGIADGAAPDPSGGGVPSRDRGGDGGASEPGAVPGGSPEAPASAVPTLPQATERELAVLGPLIAAMDTGQRAGTPLVLGIATSIVGTGLPADESLPPEARPVLAALASLIATPGAQVNEVTTQNSVYLAELDRALGELAFANPALNATIHQTADLLAAMGRAAEPVSPPGAVSLADLSVLLGFFVVD